LPVFEHSGYRLSNIKDVVIVKAPIVRKIEIYKTEEKYRIPVQLDSFTLERKNSLFIHITARTGNQAFEGWGEGTPLNPSFTGETCEEMIDDIERRIAPVFIGREIGSIQSVLDLIKNARYMKYGGLCALSAVDMALFDMLGRFMEKPVFTMIREFLHIDPVDIDSLFMPLSTYLGFINPGVETEVDDITERVINLAEKGFRFFEVPIYRHTHLPHVIEIISHIKGKLNSIFPGTNFSFSLDANESFKNIEDIKYIGNSDLSVFSSIIQPFHRDIPYYSSLLRKTLKEQKKIIPILADQSASSVERTRNVVESGAIDGIVVRTGRSGGFSFVVDLFNYLSEHSEIPVVFSSLHESGLGTSANIHSALVLDGFRFENSGYGFDQFPGMSVGENLNEKDSIKYINPERGWTDIDRGGHRVINYLQAVGNGMGLGQEINVDYILSITQKASIISGREGKIVIHRFPYRKGKPDNRKVDEEIRR